MLYAYLDIGAILRQARVRVYPCNGCTLYSRQAQQDVYCLPECLARNQLLDPLELLLAELVQRSSLYVDGETGDLTPLVDNPGAEEAHLYRIHQAEVCPFSLRKLTRERLCCLLL